MNALQLAMQFTLEAEKGWTPINGGTMYGVEQATYDSWRTSQGLPTQSVRLISQQEVAAIMKNEYWTPAHCDLMPTKLAIAHFDTAYNEGCSEAIRILQYCVDVETDGIWGPVTEEALQQALNPDEGGLLEAYLSRRIAVYKIIAANNPYEAQYLDGWENRMNNLKTYLQRIAA